jgi:uncharacterized protein YwqG
MHPEIQRLMEALRCRIAANADLAGVDVLSLARPSIRLTANRVADGSLEQGASRIGGTPDVPPQWDWPRWMPTKTSKLRSHPGHPAPLGFIAQIDLSTLPSFDDSLPDAGWLYFFYDRYCEPWGFDPDDRGACRVFYVTGERSRLVRAELPSDLDKTHRAQPCAVESRLDLTIADSPDDLDFESPAFDAYFNFVDEFTTELGPAQHRMLGPAQNIQGEMELECQLASHGIYCGNADGFESERAQRLREGARDWRLLLQIDTDEEGPRWMWGDVGRIYFWIKQQDLRSLRFDDVWLILQCG